ILYELITGKSPFLADTMPELIVKVLSETPAPLSSKRPDAPDALGLALMKCLEKDRNRRYESVGELAFALVPFAPRRSRTSMERISGVLRGAGLSASALVVPPSSDPRDAQSGTQASFGRTQPQTSGAARTAVFVGAACLALGAAGAAWLRRPSQEPKPLPVESSAPAISTVSAIEPPSLVVASAGATTAPIASNVDAPSVAPARLPAADALARPTQGPQKRGALGAKSTANPPSTPSKPAQAAPTPVAAAQPSPPAPKKSNAFDDRK
ncbi:MAG TPA: hypothetical protein VGM29_13930, partial [Polyangiaceae bacterium]